MVEAFCPGVAEDLQDGGGYLIGDLGTTKLGRQAPSDVQISAGDNTGTVTLPLRSAWVVLVRNLGFPGLRHFRE